MPHFLDTLPFDWTRPEARELRDFLSSIMFRVEPVSALAREAGLNPAAIDWQQPMDLVWHQLIESSRNQDRLRTLLDRASERIGEANAERLRELIQRDPVVEAPSPPAAGPAWSEPGETERQIFAQPTLLDIAFLQRGLELAPAVARLLVTLPTGVRCYGTAFRVGEDMLLTNHHVLHDLDTDEPAVKIEAWFGYETDFAGRSLEHHIVHCRAETIVADKTHDWAVVRASTPLPAKAPRIPLDGADPVSVGDRVYIIQHPHGGTKKIGMHHNIVRYCDDRVVDYWTDTEKGSSGAPVFDERWHLVGLHRGVAPGGSGEYRNRAVNALRVAEGLRQARQI